ncbi:MAG: outer membrane beta-barrel protein [Bacteroidota bacterium]
MKKIAAIGAFLFLLLNANYAQEFRFGFQVSPNFTWMSSDDNRINGNGTNLGLKLGMLGEKYLDDDGRYAIVSGIGFAFNQGGTLQHDIGGNFWPNSELSRPELNNNDNALPDGVNLKYGLQFVEIPFALKMRTQEFGYIRYFVEIPRFVLGINTQAQGDISGEGNVDTEDENINDDVNFFNFSWGIGGGLEYTINDNTALVGGIFFQQGFLDLTDDAGRKALGAGETVAEDSRGTISNITIRIGVMF